ncbi:MAG: MBL fold metallo-hydrolase [Dehalococcoidia bacterium]
MSELDLRFIGTGNAFAPGGLCWNGFVVNEKYLFEAPPQALQALNVMKADLNALEAVVLSHHHGDHFLGLPFLLLQWKFSNRTRPVRIIGPAGTKKLAGEIAEAVYPGVLDTTHDIEWEECGPGDRSKFGDLRLEMFEMKHDERLSGSLGFAAELGGVKFGYTGDSAMCESVIELAKRSDVLISECASRGQDLDVHMNMVKDMPIVRAAMKGESKLVLTHLGPGVDGEGLANTVVARDGERYRF